MITFVGCMVLFLVIALIGTVYTGGGLTHVLALFAGLAMFVWVTAEIRKRL